jgi:ubiquinone/menaquinone biosynthesis C-methylase UbiE
MHNSYKPMKASTAAKATWAAGDFPKMGVELAIVGEQLCDAIPIYAGDRVLDVGTASGNTAISAARRRANVTAVDLVASLLDYARRRAAIEGFDIKFQEGNAMALEFVDGSFDAVVSTFGAIFAPDPLATAAEMARVCRSAGKIAMANWTPESLIAELFALLARYSNPTPRVDAPNQWGIETVLRELLGPYIQDLKITRRSVDFRALSPKHWVDFMQEHFGPAIDALTYSSDPAQKSELTREMLELAQRHNHASNRTFFGESEYLEVVAVRK